MTTDTPEALPLPCPHCGGRPEIDDDDDRFRVRCLGCGATGPAGYFDDPYDDEGIDAARWSAVNGWNRRPDAAQSAPAVPQPDVLPAEAIYGFAAWLTCRSQSVTLSGAHNAAPAADLVEQYRLAQGWAPPRDGYTDRLKRMPADPQSPPSDPQGGPKAEPQPAPAGDAPLDDNEADPIRLWAEIVRLREAVKGPTGYATWQEAATAERMRRVKAEAALAAAAQPAPAGEREALKRCERAIHHAFGLSCQEDTGYTVPEEEFAALLTAGQAAREALAAKSARGQEADDEHPAETALRRLASWLGAGGHNATTVDAEAFEAKIRWGVENAIAERLTLARSTAPTDEHAEFEAWHRAGWHDDLQRWGNDYFLMRVQNRWLGWCARAALAQPATAPSEPFQQRVQPWMLACFGAKIAGDKVERNHRFLEEALELVQACGCTRDEAHQLVDYTFGRPAGERGQEVGGVMVTLAALCLAQGLDMHTEAETELARIWTKVGQIRAKQAAKPKHSPLPAAAPSDDWSTDISAGHPCSQPAGAPSDPTIAALAMHIRKLVSREVTDEARHGAIAYLRSKSLWGSALRDAEAAAPAQAPSDADIIALRDEMLPSQGEGFDCIAFARTLLARYAGAVAPSKPAAWTARTRHGFWRVPEMGEPTDNDMLDARECGDTIVLLYAGAQPHAVPDGWTITRSGIGSNAGKVPAVVIEQHGVGTAMVTALDDHVAGVLYRLADALLAASESAAKEGGNHGPR